MDCQITLQEWANNRKLDYQVEAVYRKVFGVKKFKNMIRDGKKKEVINYMRFQGDHGAGFGWSEDNSTIINISKEGVNFDFEPLSHSFEEIADKLVQKYSKQGSGCS